MPVVLKLRNPVPGPFFLRLSRQPYLSPSASALDLIFSSPTKDEIISIEELILNLLIIIHCYPTVSFLITTVAVFVKRITEKNILF